MIGPFCAHRSVISSLNTVRLQLKRALLPADPLGSSLTTLVLANLELQMPKGLYDVASLPHLHTLDIRHVTVSTENEYFLHSLNNRVPDLLLPVGTKRFSPALRTLHICASGLGALNIGDFIPVADKIATLSLGVFNDSSFLRPDALDQFTSLHIFEFWWPLYADLPFAKLAEDNKIVELRIRDRWERYRSGEWAYEDQGYVELEWSEGGSVASAEQDTDSDDTDNGDPEDQESSSSDEDDDEDTEPVPDLRRMSHITDGLFLALRHDPPYLPHLRRLILPLKLQKYYSGESDYSTPALDQLWSVLGDMELEVRFEEWRWGSESARQTWPAGD